MASLNNWATGMNRNFRRSSGTIVKSGYLLLAVIGNHCTTRKLISSKSVARPPTTEAAPDLINPDWPDIADAVALSGAGDFRLRLLLKGISH